MDTENDLWLRSDLPISQVDSQYLHSNLEDAINSFISAMIEYQSFLLTHALQFEKKAKIDIQKYTECFVCEKTHTHDKCVMCFDRFKEGDICLKLNCGHFFHRNEITKFLYE